MAFGVGSVYWIQVFLLVKRRFTSHPYFLALEHFLLTEMDMALVFP